MVRRGGMRNNGRGISSTDLDEIAMNISALVAELNERSPRRIGGMRLNSTPARPRPIPLFAFWLGLRNPSLCPPGQPPRYAPIAFRESSTLLPLKRVL